VIINNNSDDDDDNNNNNELRGQCYGMFHNSIMESGGTKVLANRL
jgi:hypothetical protein